MAEMTGTLAGHDGTPLFFRHWPAADGGGGGLPMVIVHGGCEHSGRYAHVGEYFARAGYAVWAADLRGHGRSGGAPMVIRTFDDYLQDVRTVLRHAAGAGDRRPVLVGHSMGGLIALHYALGRPDEVSLLAVSSPWLENRVPVPAHLRVLAPLLSRVAPRMHVPNNLASETLTRDPEFVQRHREDALIRTVATPRFFVECLGAQQSVLARVAGLQVPALFLVAGQDRLARPETTRAAYEQVRGADKALRWYDDCYHELFNETIRDQVLDDLLAWLNARAGVRRGEE